MAYELKRLTTRNFEAALAKASTYRDPNRPEEAESICQDVLDVDAKNQHALRILGLALTDRLAGPLACASERTFAERVGRALRTGDRRLREARGLVRAHVLQRHRVGANRGSGYLVMLGLGVFVAVRRRWMRRQ